MAASSGVFTPGIISLMTGYASNAYGLAEAAIGALGGNLEEVVLDSVDFEVIPIDPAGLPDRVPAPIPPGDTPEVDITIPDVIEMVEFEGERPDLDPISRILFSPPLPLDFPSNDATRPEYGLVPPSPVTDTYPIPPEPPFVIPPDPDLHEISIPEFIDITIEGMTTQVPVFIGSVPNFIPLGPSDFDTRFDNETQSNVYAAVKNKLVGILVNGGTLLAPQVEADIWQRNLERDQQALRDTVDKVTGQWAKLGFSMPDGLLSGSIIAVNNEYMNKSLDRSREIAVKQAELEQVGTIKALELGVSWENMIFSTLVEYVRRRLEVAKYNSDLLVQVFKDRVTMYNISLEAFKADVEVYKAKIQAEIGRAEVYKSKVQGQLAIAQVNDAIVKSYTAKIDALGSLVNLFNSRVKAVATMYEAEKQKIDIFRGEVEGYSAKTDALTKRYLGEIEAYKADVQGVSAKQAAIASFSESEMKFSVAQFDAEVRMNEADMKLFIAEVDAYIAEVKGRATQSEANNANADAQSKANVARFNALITKYESVVNLYSAQVEAYKGSVQAFAAEQNSKDTNMESQARVAIASYEAAIKKAEAEARIKETAAQIRMEGMKGAAQSASNLAAGAMSAIHASVSDSYQNSYQQVHSYLEK
jgi:hypothetical protein